MGGAAPRATPLGARFFLSLEINTRSLTISLPLSTGMIFSVESGVTHVW